jgi:hypothetical protein
VYVHWQQTAAVAPLVSVLVLGWVQLIQQYSLFSFSHQKVHFSLSFPFEVDQHQQVSVGHQAMECLPPCTLAPAAQRSDRPPSVTSLIGSLPRFRLSFQ